MWDKASFFLPHNLMACAMNRIPPSCLEAFPNKPSEQMPDCQEIDIDMNKVHWKRAVFNSFGVEVITIDISEHMIENVKVHEVTPKILMVEYTDAGDASLQTFVKAYIFIDNMVTGQWMQAENMKGLPMIAIHVEDQDKNYRVAVADFRYYVCTNPTCNKSLDKTPDRYECPDCLLLDHRVFFCNRACFDAGKEYHLTNCVASLDLPADRLRQLPVRATVAPDTFFIQDGQGMLFQQADTAPKFCVVCAKGGDDLRRCKPCFRKLNVCVYYCGMECAKADRRHHLPTCGKNRVIHSHP